MAYSSVNPFDGKLLKSFDQLTDQQLEQKLAAAETCYKKPGSTPVTPSAPRSSPRRPSCSASVWTSLRAR